MPLRVLSIYLFLIHLHLACGVKQEEMDNAPSKNPVPKAFADNRRQIVAIPVFLTQRSSSLTLAANATSFSVTLDGCVSGYTSTANELSTNLQVIKYDQDCLAKLTEFEINGVTYSAAATGATNFTTWAVNNTAIFANTLDDTDKLIVKVIAQLGNPITGTEAVTYSFYNITQGADSVFPDTSIGDAHTMTVNGYAPPSFTLNSKRYVGMTANGEGEFEFTLHCTVALGNANTTCKDAILTDLDYKLVEDTFGGTLTLAQADTIFSTPGTEVDASEVVDAGDADQDGNTLVRGGFYTNESTLLTGPTTIHSKPNMILIVRNTLSYLYFNIDVTTLTQD